MSPHTGLEDLKLWSLKESRDWLKCWAIAGTGVISAFD